MSVLENAGNLPRNSEVNCCDCGLYGLCKIAGLNDLDSSAIDRLVHRRKKVAYGEVLVRAGDAYSSLYAVKSGMFKTVNFTVDGEEQVVDFHLPGELIGLEAMSEGKYPYNIVALENSSVCDMDIPAVEKLSDNNRQVQQRIIEALSHKVRLDQIQALLVGAQNADQRVALFLMNIANRFDERGLPYEEFRLSMLRRDIANYLGLALETVGRVFKRFEQKGYLETRGRFTHLTDIQSLQALAGINPDISRNEVA